MAEEAKAPDMGALLQYFEERSRSLDAEGQPYLDTSTLQFISLIKFNGVPILPPVLTQNRREEMQSYKREALRRENRNRTKKREELHAKVQSIVAGVEERRAAKQAQTSRSSSAQSSPASSSGKSSSKRSQTSEVVRLSSSKSAFSSTAKGTPSEIVINVPAPKTTANTGSSSKSSSTQAKSTSSKPSSKSSTAVSTAKSSSSSTTAAALASTSSPSRTVANAKSTFTNYKSLGKLGSLSKQKSFSSQHLDRTPSKSGKYDSDNSSGSGKNLSLSPKSQGLLPHPPVGRPPSRGSAMRQSASTPDLRYNDFSVKTEDLKKPLPSRSRSPKGGRPQAPEKQTDSKVKTKTSDKTKKTDVKVADQRTQAKTIQSEPKALGKDSETVKDKKIRKPEANKSNTTEMSDVSKLKQKEKDTPAISKVKLNQPVPQNPLEILDQELSLEEESERFKRHEKRITDSSKMGVRQELDPIQTAAAELFPFPISEEQALATLDSLHSDFASLEQTDTLPCDYNGIPLTSLKQQQIILMLTKLSKALNIEDTLMSTTSSSTSGEPAREINQDTVKGQSSKYQSGVNNRGVPIGASGRGYGQYEPVETVDACDDLYVNVTGDSSITGPSSGSVSNTSTTSNHSRARMSPTGSSSILSSASSVSGSRLRMSPKSLKNTVHFSSFVTEISTSASQSLEDKISFRKLDITPKSSENFEEDAENVNDSKNLYSSGSAGGSCVFQTPTSLLSKVNLSPSVDSSSGSPGEFHHNQEFPFESENHDGELNTSDKENEFVQPETESSDENFQNEMNVRPNNRNQQVLNVYMANIPAGPIGENHPALVKASVKSDASETSTLKGSDEKMLQEDLFRYNLALNNDIHNGTGTDLGKYMHGTTAGNSSTSSLQEEITRSYLISKQKSDLELKPMDEKYEIRKTAVLSKTIKESPILLKPVIHVNSQKSLKVNRSMLEEEELIRSNLQNVQLDDTEEYSTTDEEEEIEEESHTDQPIAITVQKEEEEESHTDQPITITVQEEEESEQEAEPEIPEAIKTGEVEGEEEAGKADHIQKYLTQVHEQSLQHEEDFQEEDPEESKQEGYGDVMDIGSMIQTFTSSIQSLNHLSQDDLFRIQAEQFELLQTKLIEQQRAQLEELFVSQRREQMNLQSEIETYSTRIQMQENIETIQLQDSLQPQISTSLPQVTHAWQYQPQHSAVSPPFPVQPVASTGFYQPPITSGGGYNTGYSSIPFSNPQAYSDPRAYPDPRVYPDPRGVLHGDLIQSRSQDPDLSHISHNTSYSTIPHLDPGVIRGNLVPHMATSQHSQEQRSSGASNPFIYPSSPSLYLDPKDRDNASEVSGFANASPKQLVFSNQSTPVPKVYKPVMRSPVKQPSLRTASGRVFCPDQVLEPAMQPKFARVSAVVKGYLTRRLLRTEKVQEIVKTIDDTRNFAFSFQAETPIKKGTFSREDRTLLERIVAQLQAALLDIHEIFFIIPGSERMEIIAHSRHLQQDRRMRESQRSSMESVSRSHPKLSKATMRAMERKRQAQIAEEAVFGSTEFRPRSAPPNTSSPHPATDIRALRPLQGHHSDQISPIRPDSQITVREVKERPRTAGDKSKISNSGKTKKSSGNKAAKTTTKPSNTSTSNKQKAVPSISKKMDKAWR